MLCLISLIDIIIIIINIEMNYLFPFSNLFIKFITFFAVIAKKILLLYYKCIVFFFHIVWGLYRLLSRWPIQLEKDAHMLGHAQ